ncbi:MAG: hypothetical protein ABI639_15970 [Thermoanaerobaculia bacterium]
MSGASNRLTFTEIEIRSYLPSGWGIGASGTGSWNGNENRYELEVYDPADNLWPLQVTGKEAAAKGRLEALRLSVDRVYRNSIH